MQGILLAESYWIQMGERKQNFEENFFSAKITSGQALFPPLVKAKNPHQNFEKHLKQKRCTIKRGPIVTPATDQLAELENVIEATVTEVDNSSNIRSSDGLSTDSSLFFNTFANRNYHET